MYEGNYLLNLTISGIKSIKEPVRFDFYKKTLDKNFSPDKYKIKAIYGENGAGKTAVILGASILQKILLKENYLGESETQEFIGKIINKEKQKIFIECEFRFRSDVSHEVYKYSLEIGKNVKKYVISKEKLSVRKSVYLNDSYITIFETKNGELNEMFFVDMETYLQVKVKTLDTLSYTSFCIALHYALDFGELLLKAKYVLFGISSMANLAVNFVVCIDKNEIIDQLKNMPIEKEMLQICQRKARRLEMYLQAFGNDLQSVILEKKKTKEYYECRLKFDYGKYDVYLEDESEGIKKLVALFECFDVTGDRPDRIVFIDDIDANVNDVYLEKLIEYFMYYGKGQLCFTIHNPGIMNVLKKNKKSIDCLAMNNKVTSWTASGNASPEKAYKNGMMEYLPFNVDPSNFLGVFGDDYYRKK